MGWHFEWVSSFGSDFSHDFHVSFTAEQLAQGRVGYNFGTITTDPRQASTELPGLSVSARNAAGEVFETCPTDARGLDAAIDTHHHLDLTPEGRKEGACKGWPRRHDEHPPGRPAAAPERPSSGPS